MKTYKMRLRHILQDGLAEVKMNSVLGWLAAKAVGLDGVPSQEDNGVVLTVLQDLHREIS